jgi:hypothetical protein
VTRVGDAAAATITDEHKWRETIDLARCFGGVRQIGG